MSLDKGVALAVMPTATGAGWLYLLLAVVVVVAGEPSYRECAEGGALDEPSRFWKCVGQRLAGMTTLRLANLGLTGMVIDKQAAIGSNVTFLDLSGNSLRTFPTAALHFGRLAVLDLRNNDISAVPPQVSSFLRRNNTGLVILMSV